MENVHKVLDCINDNDLVLDVGGWACPFNRANYVLDAEPFETRGYYETVGLPKSQGGEKEFFSETTWVQRDICDKEPWPFSDNFFDFSICSHTLEDIRDPLYVCSELIRVSKRGYIEVPSRLIESCRGCESEGIVGLSHHRWLVEISDNNITFFQKYHAIHGNFELSFPSSYMKKIPKDSTISYLLWNNDFTFEEIQIHGVENISNNLREYVSKRYQYSFSRRVMGWANRTTNRIARGIQRRVGMISSQQ
jgi:hypothetical protein